MNRFPELVSLKKKANSYLTNENNYLLFSKKNYRSVFFLKTIQTEEPFLNFPYFTHIFFLSCFLLYLQIKVQIAI